MTQYAWNCWESSFGLLTHCAAWILFGLDFSEETPFDHCCSVQLIRSSSFTPRGHQLLQNFPVDGGFNIFRFGTPWILKPSFQEKLSYDGTGLGLCFRMPLEKLMSNWFEVWKPTPQLSVFDLAGHGVWPSHDWDGVAFSDSYQPRWCKLAGTAICGGWRGIMDGVQGDPEFLHKLFRFKRF